jgi:ATP synthase protein I
MAQRKPAQREYRDRLAEQIARKQHRRIKGKRQREHAAWYGLSLFGIVGWSVMIPLLICLAIGIAIDSRWPSRISWTLIFLLIGAVLGSLNAWYWVSRERKTIEEEESKRE